MNNYQAIAYATIALKQLKEENVEINEDNITRRMLELMDLYTESEIYKKYSNNETY